jgi:acetate kinase
MSNILVLNAGSSTLKFTLFADADLHESVRGLIDWKSGQSEATVSVSRADASPVQFQASIAHYQQAVATALGTLEGRERNLVACAHRVVHGGDAFRESVVIDDKVKMAIARFVELAPLHNPPALEAIEAAQAALPHIPHVAGFDTAFFANLAPRAHVYPLPYAWYTERGIRRFGFHGLSYQYCTARTAELLGTTSLRLVICHLGNGCSAAAVRDGQAQTTTMGFTPLEGLMMGTRSGSIDPGILFRLAGREHMSLDDLDRSLNFQSGLLGVSGISNDYRLVEEAAVRGNDRARLALGMFADRVRAAVGALAVQMGGLDALVFTAGIGEHSGGLRAEVCRGLECLDLRIDPAQNLGAAPDCDIAETGSSARILVLHTREELVLAREATRLTRTMPPR